MNEIHLGQPSDQYKNWCKKWYTQKFGRCIRTGNEYENNDICEVSTTNVDGIVKTVKINRYTAKNTVLESNATYLKLTNSYHTTYYIVIYDG